MLYFNNLLCTTNVFSIASTPVYCITSIIIIIVLCQKDINKNNSIQRHAI